MRTERTVQSTGGEIPSRRIGSLHRLKLTDVLLYREVNAARRKDAFDEDAAGAKALGLY